MKNTEYYQKSRNAIITTILYRDIFNFPLSKDELWRFLISEQRISKADFNHALSLLSKYISYKDGFYCLTGKEANIKKRRKNLAEAEKKYRLAQNAAKLLSFIPTVLFIGLSGGVAVGNVEEADDIDLFIITKKNTLLMTRFWILAILETAGLRRKRYEHASQSANKICVNLLIDESELAWPAEKHDIYIAHEIVQMKPLFEREGMYRKFLSNNEWVKKFFPNVSNDESPAVLNNQANNYYTLKVLSALINFSPIPFFIGKIQKVSMKKNQTSEILTDTMLAFHPNDYRKKTLKAYTKLVGAKMI